MQLVSLTLENFRGYRESTTLRIADFTTIIGRNDVGKSTLLDALEIFFNQGKPDSGDAHIDGQDQSTRISCKFDNLPQEVVIDDMASTTLAGEFMLDADGLLEIVTEYDLQASRIRPKIFVRAQHPSVEGGNDLLQLTNSKLKARAKELGIGLENADKRTNSSIRREIWTALGELALQEKLIPLSVDDAKKVWISLTKEMPTFALFQADRRSRDDDSEVTNPLDTAIKEAVKGLQDQLDEIKERVKNKVEEVANRTLAKLREIDENLADELHPEFKAEPKWAGFKLSLTDRRGVPINKRGSGFRRLILLSFLRAEAELRQQTSNAPGIIYAIEEPESSQHPNNQRLLIDALLRLSEAERTQVIITTHVPGIAALVPQESIRHICPDETWHPAVSADTKDDILRCVADELGILPDNRVCLLLYVEGPNDVSFLEHASRLSEHVDLATDPRVAFVVSGGGNLKHWVTKRYLSGLGLREMHIYDRDRGGQYQTAVDEVNARPNEDLAVLTKKREIENYLHPDTVRDKLDINIEEFDDEDDVPLLVARALHEASESPKTWSEVDEDMKKRKSSNAKKRLCDEVIASMTYEQLRERDSTGEVEGWFRHILESLEAC